jgi:hypothetical protein
MACGLSGDPAEIITCVTGVTEVTTFRQWISKCDEGHISVVDSPLSSGYEKREEAPRSSNGAVPLPKFEDRGNFWRRDEQAMPSQCTGLSGCVQMNNPSGHAKHRHRRDLPNPCSHEAWNRGPKGMIPLPGVNRHAVVP